jgi:hypothetical protein
MPTVLGGIPVNQNSFPEVKGLTILPTVKMQ